MHRDPISIDFWNRILDIIFISFGFSCVDFENFLILRNKNFPRRLSTNIYLRISIVT